jgi:GNAT superfamily N-acetyltransferase
MDFYKSIVDVDDEESGDFKIIAVENNIVIGKIYFVEMWDNYEVDFKDIITEDEFDELFPDMDIANINYLTVNEEYRNNGVGRKLMELGMAARNFEHNDNETKQFYLNACTFNNANCNLDDLVKFYKSLGFKEFKRHENNVHMYFVKE